MPGGRAGHATQTLDWADASDAAIDRSASSVGTGIAIEPRFVRLRDAPRYFGMDTNRFNREIRPQLTEIRIGSQGYAFDRIEMSAVAEDY